VQLDLGRCWLSLHAATGAIALPLTAALPVSAAPAAVEHTARGYALSYKYQVQSIATGAAKNIFDIKKDPVALFL
jgi:hypothetical protein